MSTQAISSNAVTPVSVGQGLPPGAIALMLMLCVSWGFNQLAVKLALPDVPPMLQAMIRSAGALPVMLMWVTCVAQSSSCATAPCCPVSSPG